MPDLLRRIGTACALLAALMGLQAAHGQEIRVDNQILTDSVKVGEPFKVSLRVKYPEKHRILFPDSSYAFSPYVFRNLEYFPTRKRNGILTDSAVYTLQAFSLRNPLTLKLPVFLIQKQDSATIYAKPDTLGIKYLINSEPDSIRVKETTELFHVPRQRNYPFLMMAGGALLLALILLTVIFRKPLLRRIRLYRLRKHENAFCQAFDELQETFLQNPGGRQLERIVVFWKKETGRLLNMPLSSMSTPELQEALPDEQLSRCLTSLDRAVYGKGRAEEEKEAVAYLRQYTVSIFEQKKEEIRHG